MDIWNYDRKTGVLLGRATADTDPDEPGAWLIPAYATTIRPPAVPEGCVAIFNGGLSAVGEWRIEMLDLSEVADPKECAAIAAFVSAHIENRPDRDKALAEAMCLLGDMIDRAIVEKVVRDDAKSVVRALIYGKGMD